MTAQIMAPSAHWAALRSSKLDWAYRAYRRFIAELSPDVRAHLIDTSDQEPYIVVFGMTQVGKTTLLLELMGLGLDGQVRVGRILRGGRESGKSATATTMEYRRSQDNDWRFDDGSGIRRIANDDKMAEVLAELRQRMSEQRLYLDQPVVVSIPSDCFGAGFESLRTRMLDLPGDNPADEIERAHVEKMAERYVPHADLILLVGRGDDLSFLNPAALKLPSIEDWQYVPQRFRIVTTYAFTPQSVQQFVHTFEGELGAEHFRERLLQQIDTFKLKLAPEAAKTARFFPLEIGDSWQTLLREDTPFKRCVEPIIMGLKEALHSDIRSSATEGARFRNAMDVHIVTQRKREARRAAGIEALIKLADRIGYVDESLQRARDGSDRAKSQLETANAMLSRRAAVETVLAASFVFDPTEYIEKVDILDTNTSALFSLTKQVSAWLRTCYLNKAPASRELEKFLGMSHPNLTAKIPEMTRIATDEFSALKRRMEGYKTNEYYPKLSEAFSKDKNWLREDINEAAIKTGQFAHSLWNEQLIKRITEIEAEVAIARSTCIDMEQVIAHHDAQRDALAVRWEEMRGAMDQEIARFDRDEATAARFGAMLDEEYLAELRQKHAHVAMASQPVDAMLTLLSVNDIGNERRKIKLTSIDAT